MFTIQAYAYDAEALERLEKGLPLDVEPSGYVHLSIPEWLRMQKSLRVADAYLRLYKAKDEAVQKAPAESMPKSGPGKAKTALPAGARWITVHPNGRDQEGHPVLIQESGDGTAHIIAGAGGKLNGLKLNKIKSKEEYAQAIKDKKERDKLKAAKERLAEQQRITNMTPREREQYRAGKKLQKQAAEDSAAGKKKQRAEAERRFVGAMIQRMGWDAAEFTDVADEAIQVAKHLLETALDDDADKETLKKLRHDLSVAKKAKKRALDSQRKHFLAAAKDIVRGIEHEVIGDADLRQEIETRLGTSTGAAEVIRTKNKGTGKGFATQYRESAAEKGKLDEGTLAAEKDEIFDARMAEIRYVDERPELADMIEKGIQTNREISAFKNGLYEPEELPKAPIASVDERADILKQYLEMKHTLASLEDREAGQYTMDGEVVPEHEEPKDEGPEYGRGTKLDFVELFADDLADEATRIFNARQAAVHSSLLATVEKNSGGSGKWIANGNYAGLNAISLAALKDEGLDRDIVDVLGIGASAQLMAMKARRSMSAQGYEDLAESMERYHAEMNEALASEATEKANELIARAESIQEEIDATDPGELAALRELNESRLAYLDEANQIAGQALGSLEASAAMVAELKRKRDPASIEVNMGAISTEDAIIRTRALGLEAADYEIQTVAGNKILTITAPQKLIRISAPEDREIEQEVASIKAGQRDEQDWLPEGLVRRSAESFQDPGIGAKVAPGSVDAQSLGDTAPQVKQAEEAAHRTLGEMPEGAFAFKAVEDLSPQDQTDIRRYWETKLYAGTMASRGSKAKYQEKGISRQAAWAKFFRGKHQGDKESAFDAIRDDLIENHSEEDMFGEKSPPPLARVIPGAWKTYKSNVDGARELFQAIEDLSDSSMVTDAAAAERERQKLEAELPEKLTELYEGQMRSHYLTFMSGYSEAQFSAGEERQEGSPWAEYVRMHGSVDRAQAAVLDCIKGEFVERFAGNYAKTSKRKLNTKVAKIRNYQDHVLGLLDPEMRDSYKNKFTAQLASAGATVANRVGGKFAAGSWKEAAYRYLEDQKKADAAQMEMFGGEDLRQDDGTEVLSIGERAEQQLASMIPSLTGSIRRGQKFAVSRGMDSNGERQRAIRMLEASMRMNLTFGTGKGKTIISIGAFANLKAKGKAKRAIFAVPSVVQAQFGSEVSVFCEPGRFKVSAEPGLSRKDRIAAMRDGNLDMVVCTHQSLRDDLVYLMAQHQEVDEEKAKETFNAASEPDRRTMLRAALDAAGISFDMLTVDESHYATNRQGKEDSTLSNVLTALNQNVTYFMNQSATPVKNDISEAYDMLHKVAPERFSDRTEFMKRFSVDSHYARTSLQRLINRYNYSSQTVTGVQRAENREDVQLSPEQQAEYDHVLQAFQTASKAQRSGTVDVNAMRYLSPHAFSEHHPERHQEIAQKLQASVGIIKEEALNRVVNQFDWKRNAKVKKVLDIIDSKRYKAAHPKTASKPGDRIPGVIFAHNIKTIDNLREALESKGLRVGVIQGSMNGAEKEKVKLGFNPPSPQDRIYDVLVCSDAGATGLNLQNAGYLINYDLPQTSWLKQQREGRIDRHGQSHASIDYHDIVSATDHETTKWERIQRKKKLGAIFEEDPGTLDDSGLAQVIANVRRDRYNRGMPISSIDVQKGDDVQDERQAG